MSIGHNSGVRGTFADFKTVKTRGVCQLIIEVPIEAADHALAVLGGVPQMKSEQWVGLAPITAPETAEEAPQTETAPEAPDVPEKVKGGPRTKRAWHELTMPEQAGIFVHDLSFAKWLLSTEYEGYASTVIQDDAKWKLEADAVLKSRCGIGSKTELGVREDGSALNEFARGQFIRIESEYRASQHGTTPEAQEQQLQDGRR